MTQKQQQQQQTANPPWIEPEEDRPLCPQTPSPDAVTLTSPSDPLLV